MISGGLSKPSADSFAVGRRQKERALFFSDILKKFMFLPGATNDMCECDIMTSVRLKQELSLLAKTEYSAAKNRLIFGFG
jgi:hypothetical protein